MLELNTVVFASPKCSYSSESLFKSLIYIPAPHEDIPCLYLDNQRKPKGKVLLYFHGNAEDLGVTYNYLTMLRDILHMRVVAMEYRGYGLYRKEKSSDGLLIDSLAVYDYINKEMGVAEADIYLQGRSLGCTPACWIGSMRQPGLLILMCPFRTLQDAAKAIMGWFLGSFIVDRFDNSEMLKKVRSPVFIIHGQKDTLIPYQQSEALINSCELSKGTFLVLPPEMTHNLFDIEEDLTRPLINFLNSLGQGLLAENQIDNVDQKKAQLIYPPDKVIAFEKSIFQSNSFVWQEAQEYRSKQEQATSIIQAEDKSDQRGCNRSC